MTKRQIEIIELKTGARHYRTIKSQASIFYKVVNGYLTIYDYNTGEALQKINVKKYGSIQFRVAR